MDRKLLSLSALKLSEYLWKADTEIYRLFQISNSIDEARENFFNYLNALERRYFNTNSKTHYKDLHIIERNNAKECIRVLRNVLRTENEMICGFSSLKKLYNIAIFGEEALKDVSCGFLMEFIMLFRGINGKSGLYHDIFLLPADNKIASILRSKKLDSYSRKIDSFMLKYRKGTDPEAVKKHKLMKNKILKYFKSDVSDWNDYRWHLKHIIRDAGTLADLVKLEKDELDGINSALKTGVPFEITPYYLSLFNENKRQKDDRAVRAQVLPSETYCEKVSENKKLHVDMDFMGERSTSPIDAITRRYPKILIIKPVDVCPQICVYCQRNWEIKPISEKHVSRTRIKKALDWIRKNKSISEVLVTGGDPLILDDGYIDFLLNELSGIRHIERIRIGTRTPVTLPFRITEDLISIIKKYHDLGRREICIMTHFEHISEITSDAVEAVKRFRNAGISVYNQQVFTYYNSFKYETSALRRGLKVSGVDPYYTFITKGKSETMDFRVPISRIEQERKEEARFLPGLVRTDEPVFNVPKLGKSHLRAWQDHELISILRTGERVYRFYSWESKVTLINDYIYTDVSIYDYLKRLASDGENPNEYRSIWYYF
ncbi:MAG: KamA family radical SAM protein [Spirochaetes bacterium]|nr:KamA family radical SAM protein [Spirochaetota bacterium]